MTNIEHIAIVVIGEDLKEFHFTCGMPKRWNILVILCMVLYVAKRNVTMGCHEKFLKKKLLGTTLIHSEPSP